jgi:hypothetical protein
MLTALDLWLGPRSEIVIIGPMQDTRMQKMLKPLRTNFLPRTAVLVCDAKTTPLLEACSNMVKDRRMLNDKVTAYICEDFVCKQPITEPDIFEREIGRLR